MDLYPQHIGTWSRQTVETAIKRRCQAAYLGNDVILARILGRHKIFLRASDRGFACHLMLDGFWEIWLTQFLARYIKPNMTVVDVGANFGYYTLLFGDAVGNGGRVLAIEPNPDTTALLRETIRLNGHAAITEIIEAAVSNHSGGAYLFAPDGEPKNAGLVAESTRPNGRTTEVQTITLDELVWARKIAKVDLVKIDIEGSEVAAVEGMEKIIERDRPTIVLEFNAARYADPKAFLNKLLSYYGSFREISLDGEVRSVDSSVVTNQRILEDRLLLFK